MFISYVGQIVDTVVMNPPFGTRKKGADMDFLAVALKVKMVLFSDFSDACLWIIFVLIDIFSLIGCVRWLLKQFILCIRAQQEM